MKQYYPLSLNPELPEEPSLLSPLNYLTRRPTPMRQQLLAENKELKNKLDGLLEELELRKQKNAELNTQIHKQQRKIASWKNCYEKSQEEYIMKKQFIAVLQQKLQGLQKQTSPTPQRMVPDEDRLSEEFKEYEDSFKIERKLSRDSFVPNYVPKINRVSSIALQRKKSKRKQALSLTHLHKYSRQNY